jgi:hypothetical protein
MRLGESRKEGVEKGRVLILSLRGSEAPTAEIPAETSWWRLAAVVFVVYATRERSKNSARPSLRQTSYTLKATIKP